MRSEEQIREEFHNLVRSMYFATTIIERHLIKFDIWKMKKDYEFLNH